MEAIFKRRSVRKFTPAPVADEAITLLLKAAMRAPSAVNEQPWEFVVLQDREHMAKIKEFHPYAAMVDTAACVLVVCADKDRKKSSHDFLVQDCCAATQNILLEAVHLGLGAVWVSIYPVQERMAGMANLLGLPANIVPISAVAVGHPAVAPEPKDTFDAGRIHYETWGSGN